MNLLPGEKVLSEAGASALVITTHRIRSEARAWGFSHITSIVLEELTSCELKMISYPVLLLLAGAIAAACAGYLAFGTAESYLPIVGFVPALVCVFFYFASRCQVLSFASPTARTPCRPISSPAMWRSA